MAATKDDERAELIAALHQSAGMIGKLLDLTDRLIEALETHERPSAEEIDALRVQARNWREQLDRVRQRLASVMIEPPNRVQ